MPTLPGLYRVLTAPGGPHGLSGPWAVEPALSPCLPTGQAPTQILAPSSSETASRNLSQVVSRSLLGAPTAPALCVLGRTTRSVKVPCQP